MTFYSSEFKRNQRRVWISRLRAMAAGGFLVGAFLLVSRWDFQDATAAAAPAFVQETGCRAPREGEVLYARVEREPEGSGMGYLCTYYSNAGFGRKARAERRDYVRMGRAG